VPYRPALAVGAGNGGAAESERIHGVAEPEDIDYADLVQLLGAYAGEEVVVGLIGGNPYTVSVDRHLTGTVLGELRVVVGTTPSTACPRSPRRPS
jgi:xanthosine utilization system XapX-like protein